MRAAICFPPASCSTRWSTGQLPFQGQTVATIFESLLTKAPVPPSEIKAGIPAELDRIILKALEKDRETRYQGAAEMRADLKRLKRTTDSGLVGGRRSQPAASRRGGSAAGSTTAKSRWRTGLHVGAPLLTAALDRRLLLLSIGRRRRR